MSDRVRRSHRFTITPEHLTFDPRVGDRSLRLWCLIDRLGASEQAVESVIEDLSIELDCSPSSVTRSINELVSAGWLQVDRQPGGSIYTLVVAPAKAVTKLAEEAREARRARWKGKVARYRAATATRPVEDRKHTRKDYASSQVNPGGAVTHECPDGTDVQSPVTAPGVQSPMSARAVTGDCRSLYRDPEKVTTPLTPQRDAGKPADAAASTRDDSTDDDALFDADPAAAPSSGRSARGRSKATKEDDPRHAKARELVAAWWDALPVKPAGSRTFMNITALVAEDLAAGRTETEIARALTSCGVAVTRNAINFQYEAARRAAVPRPSAIRDQGYLADPAADFFAGSTRPA